MTYADHIARAEAAQARVYTSSMGVPGGGDPCVLPLGRGEWVGFPVDPSALGDGPLAMWHGYLAQWHVYVSAQAGIAHAARKGLEAAHKMALARARAQAARDGYKGNEAKAIAEGADEVLAALGELAQAEVMDAAVAPLAESVRSLLGVMREEIKRRAGAAGPRMGGPDGGRG